MVLYGIIWDICCLYIKLMTQVLNLLSQVTASESVKHERQKRADTDARSSQSRRSCDLKSKWRNKDVLRQLSIKTRAQHCAGTQGCFTCNKASWNRLITSKSVFCDKIEHRSRHVHHCSVWVQMSTFIYHNRRCRMCGTTHFEFLFTGIGKRGGKRPVRRTHHLWTFSKRGFTRRGSKWIMLNDLRIICDTLQDRKRKPPFLIQALTEQSAEQSICFRAFLGSW